jgi:hypothetical protein
LRLAGYTNYEIEEYLHMKRKRVSKLASFLTHHQMITPISPIPREQPEVKRRMRLIKEEVERNPKASRASIAERVSLLTGEELSIDDVKNALSALRKTKQL